MNWVRNWRGREKRGDGNWNRNNWLRRRSLRGEWVVPGLSVYSLFPFCSFFLFLFFNVHFCPHFLSLSWEWDSWKLKHSRVFICDQTHKCECFVELLKQIHTWVYRKRRKMFDYKFMPVFDHSIKTSCSFLLPPPPPPSSFLLPPSCSSPSSSSSSSSSSFSRQTNWSVKKVWQLRIILRHNTNCM